MLATVLQHRAATDPKGDWLNQAEAATATALRLAPLLPEAYQAHAGNLEMQGLFREALDPHMTAYELDPSNGRAAAISYSGTSDHTLGRPDLALVWFEKATRRETRPLYAIT